jgi:hypothetical protein
MRLDDDIDERLDRLAKRRDVTRAQVVRELIIQESNAVAATTDDHRVVMSVVQRWFLAQPNFRPVPLGVMGSDPFLRDLSAMQQNFYPRATLANLGLILNDLVAWRYLKLVNTAHGPAYAPTNKRFDA